MKAYKIEARNESGKKTRNCYQFAKDQAESDKLAERLLFTGEHVTLNVEVQPKDAAEAALFSFGAQVQEDRAAELIKNFGETHEKGYDNLQLHIQSWPVKIAYGRKYINVDVGGSGVFMVVKETGDIFGIKGYGTIHKGHHYGTLSTLADWDFGYSHNPYTRATKLSAPRDLSPAFTYTHTAPTPTTAPTPPSRPNTRQRASRRAGGGVMYDLRQEQTETNQQPEKLRNEAT